MVNKTLYWVEISCISSFATACHQIFSSASTIYQQGKTGFLSAQLLPHCRNVFTRWHFFEDCLNIYKKGQQLTF
jgi:hypothetical protein